MSKLIKQLMPDCGVLYYRPVDIKSVSVTQEENEYCVLITTKDKLIYSASGSLEECHHCAEQIVKQVDSLQ